MIGLVDVALTQSLMVSPEQNAVEEGGWVLIVIESFIFRIILSRRVHPFGKVAVTKYLIVSTGLA